MALFGAHFSIAGGCHNALLEAQGPRLPVRAAIHQYCNMGLNPCPEGIP
jgi:hypothetical protein